MYLPKILFYSLNCLFIYHYFPDVPFCFLKLAFCFLEVPFCFLDVPFPFSEIHYCFPAFGFSFPEMPSFYLLCMSFSKNAFFLLIVLYPCPAHNCWEICLPCSCFISSWSSLLTNLWCLLENLKKASWSMIFLFILFKF